jgi:DhnA family fructose-bisphosphate aldolase class Ia
MVGGKERRLRRLIDADGRTLLVAVDHSLTTGELGGLSDMRAVLRSVVAGGADGVIAHRGSATHAMPVQRETALVIHLSGNTALSNDSDLKIRVCDPETAVTLGADAVSAQITLGAGDREDREALADLGRISRACDGLGLPLLVMTYVRAAEEGRARAVLHAARIAAELGADIIKAAHPGREQVANLVATVPVPVVIAGGGAVGDWHDFLDSAKDAVGAGVAGLCVGRWVFGAPDPARATADLRAIVHGGKS